MTSSSKLDVSILIPVSQSHAQKERFWNQVLPEVMKQAGSFSGVEILLLCHGWHWELAGKKIPKSVRRIYCPRTEAIGGVRNRGACVAKGKRLIFLDADCIPSKRWLPSMIGYRLEGEIVAAAGEIVSCDGKVLNDQWRAGESSPLPFTGFANFIIRAEDFTRMGGLEESLSYGGEDLDFCWRLILAGYQIGYIANSAVEHPERVGSLRFWNLGRRAAQIRARYLSLIELAKPGRIPSDLTEIQTALGRWLLSSGFLWEEFRSRFRRPPRPAAKFKLRLSKVTKRATIIIPVHPSHNTPQFLGECLISLSKEIGGLSDVELVVVGDGCDVKPIIHDVFGSSRRVRSLHFGEPVRQVRARNRALLESRGEIIVFLDSDSTVETGWLKELLEPFKDPRVGAVGGKIVATDGKCINAEMLNGESYALPSSGLGNLAIRRNVIETIGPLDESLWEGNAEELDLSWRILLVGLQIAYSSKAIMIHKGVPDLPEAFSHGIGAAILQEKYRGIIPFSKRTQLVRYLKNFSYSLQTGEKGISPLTHLVVAAGFLWGQVRDRNGMRVRNISVSLKPKPVFSDDSGLQISEQILWWNTDNGCRVVDLREKTYRDFDSIGKVFWEKLLRESSVDSAVSKLSGEFNADGDLLRKDFLQFIHELEASRIIERVPAC